MTATPGPTQATIFVLPDGASCRWAGEGATLVFDGKRVNYTCSKSDERIIALLGDPTPGTAGVWSVEKATINHDSNGFTLASREALTLLAATLALADGTQCAFAGQGATLAFAGKRLNYTCSKSGTESVGIIGDLAIGEGGVITAEKVLIDRSGSGATVKMSSQVVVKQINGAAVKDTAEKTSAITGATALTGTVTYRQRIALPPGSVITIQLQDVSKADAAAQIIASQTITTTGENVPIPFTLAYDPAQIDPKHAYALSARITVTGQLRWINTERYAVLTNGAPTNGVEVVVQPAR